MHLFHHPPPFPGSPAVPVRCVDQSSDGLPEEESVRRPMEERPAALSHLCPLHHAQSCAVRHCQYDNCAEMVEILYE